MYIPSSSPFYLSLPLYYVLCIFLDRITIVSSYLLVPISLRCTMISTRRRNLCFFHFFLLFFIFFYLYFYLFFLYFYFLFSTMKAHDFGGGMLFGYVYGCLFYVHCHSRIVTFSGTTLGSLLLVFFFICLNMSQVRSTLLDQICFSSDSWDYAQISNNQTYRSLHGDGL